VTDTLTLPSHDTVTASLEVLSALGGASDAHGLLTAMFASCAAIRKEAWINSLLSQPSESEDEYIKNAREALERMFVVTQVSLDEGDFAFSLLLPDDESGFETRIDALSSWCQGFIAGLSLVNVDEKSLHDDNVKEAYVDLLNMSCLEYDHEEAGDEEAESAYTELVEYARTAVMILYHSIHLQRQGEQVSTETH